MAVIYYAEDETEIRENIAKPFKPMLLSAKIRALLRRVAFENETGERGWGKDLVCGNLRYSRKRRVVAAGTKTLSLTPTELKFLLFLMEHFEEQAARKSWKRRRNPPRRIKSFPTLWRPRRRRRRSWREIIRSRRSRRRLKPWRPPSPMPA